MPHERYTTPKTSAPTNLQDGQATTSYWSVVVNFNLTRRPRKTRLYALTLTTTLQGVQGRHRQSHGSVRSVLECARKTHLQPLLSPPCLSPPLMYSAFFSFCEYRTRFFFPFSFS